MGTYILNNTPAIGLPSPSADTLPLEERQRFLEKAVSYKVHHEGSRVGHQHEDSAVIIAGKRVNHVLHLLLTVFTLGLWLIPWIIIAMGGGERTYTLNVDEHGTVTQRS